MAVSDQNEFDMSESKCRNSHTFGGLLIFHGWRDVLARKDQ